MIDELLNEREARAWVGGGRRSISKDLWRHLLHEGLTPVAQYRDDGPYYDREELDAWSLTLGVHRVYDFDGEVVEVIDDERAEDVLHAHWERVVLDPVVRPEVMS